MTKKSEIRMLRAKIDKERERVNHLIEKLEASENHKNQIEANNYALNRSNMLLI